jgi:hypothetical protein
MRIKFRLKNLYGRNHLEYLGTDGRTVFQRALEKSDGGYGLD